MRTAHCGAWNPSQRTILEKHFRTMSKTTYPVLLREDCLSAMKQLETGSIDLLLTDPPFGTTNLAFDQIPIDWDAWWKEVNRVCRPHAVQVIFAAQPFTTTIINANPLGFAYDLVWEKPQPVGFLSCNKKPLKNHESILIFKRKSQAKAARGIHPIYNPQYSEGTPYRHKARKKAVAHYQNSAKDFDREMPARRHPRSVLKYPRDVPSLHPTQKPVELLRWLIRSYSHSDMRVLDCFMGAGSTGVAAALEERRFVGIEMDPEYYAIALKRLRGEA